MKHFDIVIPVSQPRNSGALAARMRDGVPMKDRRAPRGGARNEMADLLAEYEEAMADLKGES